MEMKYSKMLMREIQVEKPLYWHLKYFFLYLHQRNLVTNKVCVIAFDSFSHANNTKTQQPEKHQCHIFISLSVCESEAQFDVDDHKLLD